MASYTYCLHIHRKYMISFLIYKVYLARHMPQFKLITFVRLHISLPQMYHDDNNVNLYIENFNIFEESLNQLNIILLYNVPLSCLPVNMLDVVSQQRVCCSDTRCGHRQSVCLRNMRMDHSNMFSCSTCC